MKVDFVFDEGQSKEDAHLVGKSIFGVFDGANSVNKFFGKDGRPGGLIAAEIARDEFSKNKGTLEEMAGSANRKIREKMISEGIDVRDKLNWWNTAAAVVRINGDNFEWLQLSDSLIIVVYEDTFKLLVDDYDHDREVLLEWKKYAEKKERDIKKLVRPMINNVRENMNKKWGALNGGENSKFLKTGAGELKDVKHILLFTDGLFLPKEEPAEEDDFYTFVKLFLDGGLENVKKHVRELEKTDPYCWKYPRFKQYDDIAAISISF